MVRGDDDDDDDDGDGNDDGNGATGDDNRVVALWKSLSEPKETLYSAH